MSSLPPDLLAIKEYLMAVKRSDPPPPPPKLVPKKL